MTPRAKQLAWRGALVVALLAVTWLLLAPSPAAVGPAVPYADKLQHVVLFAGLGLLAARAYDRHPRWALACAVVLYGACIELAQLGTTRSFELLDIAADGVGALAVFLVPRRAP